LPVASYGPENDHDLPLSHARQLINLMLLFDYSPLSKYPDVPDLTDVAVLSLKSIYTGTRVIIYPINAVSIICTRIRNTVINIWRKIKQNCT